ncbi:MAG: hypothetical protein IKO35_06205 [Elusimicrobiaceae bacterium]|nr:hypothetical protein [Elusimicrobiaceae bacterium]
MNKKILYTMLICFAFPLAVQADSGDPITLETTLIDVPTANVLDSYQASFLTRAYDHGTLMETIDFGVFPRINLGISIAAHELLGSSNSVRVLSPDFQLKWRVYDGNLYMPAVVVGYDGRRYGYGYNSKRRYTRTKKYLDDRKGGYVSFSREVIIPNLTATAGVNMSDFDMDEIHFFTGVFYRLTEQLGFMAEWDSIRNLRDSRANVGVRVDLHPNLALDAAVRRIGRGDESERIMQLRYVTHF